MDAHEAERHKRARAEALVDKDVEGEGIAKKRLFVRLLENRAPRVGHCSSVRARGGFEQ